MARGKAVEKIEHFIPAMLAKETDTPFSSADWIYEIKWDGYRAIAELQNGKVSLYSRNGNSFITDYPIVVDALKSLNINAVLDGEIIVLNEEGKADFQKLQHYSDNKHFPLQFYVFDLLKLDGKDLFDKPLIERKAQLQEILVDNDVVKFSDHIMESGEDFFEVAKEKDLEGIMAKKADSKYYPGKRSADWLKIKHHKSDEAIICGYTAPRGGRKYFGALVLGTMQNGQLTYVGHTGSGFDDKLLKELSAKLQPLEQEESPFNEVVKTNMPVTWVKPVFVCELKFTEVTNDGKMRHPIFLRLREDKTTAELIKDAKLHDMKKASSKETTSPNQDESEPRTSPVKKEKKKAAPKKAKATKEEIFVEKNELIEEERTGLKKATSKEKKVTPAKKIKAKETLEQETKEENIPSKDVIKNEKEHTYKFGKSEVKTTNRTKIFFPDEGYTKGDIIDYYDRMSDLILPYLKDRPESLFRTPNGINSKGFFHKDAGDEAPSYVKSISLFSESANKHIEYILCNNKETLLYLANLGCIEINPWHSTADDLDNPDYLIIDIDPSDNNTFEHVIEAANVVKQILDKAGAFSICKTSGSTGLHIYVPTAKQYSYEQVKDFAYVICMMANQLLPEITTLERSLSKRRKDQIYMDYLQNRKGQTIASVYSVRPKPGATVSTPLLWEEVKPGLNPKDFNIKTIEQRLKEKGDLFADVFKNPIDLMKCIENLEA